MITNECDACALGVGFVDDTEKLDEDDKDTGLPENWAELTLRVKVKNPEWTQAEANVKSAIAQAWPAATRQAASEKGSALTSPEVEALRDVLERQARVQMDEVLEMIVVEQEVILCHEHVELLKKLGVSLHDLFNGVDHPSVKHAGPTVVAMPTPMPVSVATPMPVSVATPMPMQDDGTLAPSVA
jgi:hypothetical protein